MRKPKPNKTKPRNVTLADDTVALAKAIGKGNLSEGIRRAVAHYQATMAGAAQKV
jgi:hypothetical protein